jgi:hypothetical protein
MAMLCSPVGRRSSARHRVAQATIAALRHEAHSGQLQLPDLGPQASIEEAVADGLDGYRYALSQGT